MRNRIVKNIWDHVLSQEGHEPKSGAQMLYIGDLNNSSLQWSLALGKALPEESYRSVQRVVSVPGEGKQLHGDDIIAINCNAFQERERSPRPFPCLRLAQSGLFHAGEHFPMDLITESK